MLVEVYNKSLEDWWTVPLRDGNADEGLALNTEVFKKWTVDLFLLGEFKARVLFLIVWFEFLCLFGFFLVKIWVLLWYFSQLLCTTNMKD